jgi:DNA modification methylase
MTLPKPYYEENGITIYHGDCREILTHLPKVDLVLTDPPYGIDWKSNWKNGNQEKIIMDLSPDFSFIKDLNSKIILMFTRMDVLNDWTNALKVWSWQIKDILVWDKKKHGAGDLNVLRHFCIDGGFVSKIHPAEKPVSLFLELISNHEVETILDPFMGSGTTLRAAKDLGRKAIGIEIEEKYCEIAVKRLRQEVFDFKG